MANQTQILNVSDEMKFDDNVQTKNVKEQEENMYSSSSDTTEELCSSQATDACGDGLFTFEEIAILCGFEGVFWKYVTVFLTEYYVPQLDFYLRGGRNYSRTFGEFLC